MAQQPTVLSIVLDPFPDVRMAYRETQHPTGSNSRQGAAGERVGATLARPLARQDCIERGSGGATLGTHDAFVAEHGA